jgi:ATP-dependent Lon protease
MATARIPIFPLEVVLFPGEVLPLHIFEPRYKDLVRDCRAANLHFGVVLTAGDSLVEVACTAEITEISRTYPNGELDIVTVGRRICRILEVIDEHSYYEAEVEYLAEGPAPKQVPSTALLQLFERCHLAAFQTRPDRGALTRATSVSYHIAGTLPLDLAYKQKLLEMRNEEERRHSLEVSLARWLEQLEHTNRVRHIAGGNGHAPPN